MGEAKRKTIDEVSLCDCDPAPPQPQMVLTVMGPLLAEVTMHDWRCPVAQIEAWKMN